MIHYFTLLVQDTIALITILNPVAAASIMLGMLVHANEKTISPIAMKTSMTVFIASLLSLYSGEFIFHLFGINVLSLKVIGGIILMLIAINMTYGQPLKSRHTKEEEDEAEEKEDISIVPLGIPILFGPGTIATIIVLNNNHTFVHTKIESYILVTLSIAIASLIVFLTLRYAGFINKTLGVTGMKILTRIMGLVVGAIAAQFLVSGIKGLWLA